LRTYRLHRAVGRSRVLRSETVPAPFAKHTVLTAGTTRVRLHHYFQCCLRQFRQLSQPGVERRELGTEVVADEETHKSTAHLVAGLPANRGRILQLRDGGNDALKRNVIIGEAISAPHRLPVGDEALNEAVLPAAHSDPGCELKQRLGAVSREAGSVEVVGREGGELFGAG
jgi:hypothetical protein